MRPITLRRVIDLCNLALSEKEITSQLVVDALKTTLSRAQELLLEIERMGLITRKDRKFVVNDNTLKLIEAFEEENWQSFHDYFLSNFSFYQRFVQLLKGHVEDEQGLLIREAVQEAGAKGLTLNRTTIEVLSNWCERLGVIQRHLYSKRFYILKDEKPTIDLFKRVLQQCYSSLNIRSGVDLRLVYVEIPRLREVVCERLKTSRELFDELFKKVYLESIGKIELSGAPTVTAAKKSPLTIRTIKASKKEDVLAPHFDLTKEREGIKIGVKSYYYVAIHSRL